MKYPRACLRSIAAVASMLILLFSSQVLQAGSRKASSATPIRTVGTNKFGLGLMVGTITSVNGNFWVSPQGSIDFGAAFFVGENHAVYADYLWHIPGIFGKGTKFGRETYGYFGGGLGIGFWDDSYYCGRWECARQPRRKSGNGIFLRGLFGFEWYPLHTQFGVFAEVGPTTLLTPSISTTLDAAVGGRYYF